MARFEVPEGWSVQAFCFALDPSPEQAACLRRQFGGRRYARNWAVRTLKDGLDRYHATGEETGKPCLARLRKRWNRVKDAKCVDAQTGEVWWPQVTKEAFADGIKGAVDGYWNWQASRAGKRAGRRAGFPRFAKKGRDRDRVTFTTGAIRVEPGRRHVTLPRIGTVRVHENTRRLERLLAKGRARILAVTVSQKGTRLIAAFRVLVQRPVQPRCRPARVTGRGRRRGPGSCHRRQLGRGSAPAGAEPPAARGSAEAAAAPVAASALAAPAARVRYTQTSSKISRLHRRIADIRAHHLHVLTTRLAKTHGEIVVEGLDAAAMLRQKGPDRCPGPPARPVRFRARRDPPPARLQDRLVRVPPRGRQTAGIRPLRPAMPAGSMQEIGWAEHWTCAGCGARHQRDDNAAINLARYQDASMPGDSAVGPVGAAVKRRADRKTGPRPAGGEEARQGTSHQAGNPTPRRGAGEMSTTAHSPATVQRLPPTSAGRLTWR